MSEEFVNELTGFICPICKLLYYGDRCLHRYTDVILFQAAEIASLTAENSSLRFQLSLEKDYE